MYVQAQARSRKHGIQSNPSFCQSALGGYSLGRGCSQMMTGRAEEWHQLASSGGDAGVEGERAWNPSPSFFNVSDVRSAVRARIIWLRMNKSQQGSKVAQ